MRAFITVGLPGSGKSTFAGYLRKAEKAEELNLDFFRFLLSGDPHNQEVSFPALKARDRRLRALAREGRDVILSDTHAQGRTRRQTIRMLHELGYFVSILFFNVGETTCLERNARRERPVPEEVIHRMARQIRGRPPSPAEAETLIVLEDPEDPLIRDETFLQLA
ncbi:MAG: AAA family ATPase [Bacteroidota bacterium]